MIRINHLTDDSKARNSKFIITFDEVSERDMYLIKIKSFHQRQYSFKIMHQLF